MAKGLAGTNLISDSNLVSYYKLEDTSDSKGSNTLTNNNSVTFGTARFNNGADQGSSNSNKYLSVAGNLGIAGNSDFSISLWLKQNTEIGSGTQVGWALYSQTTADRYIQMNYLYNGGTRRLQIDAAGTSFTYDIVLGTAAFRHIVVTRDVSGNAVRLYVDGVDVAGSTIGSSTAGQNKFTLGADPSGGQVTSWIIDDVGVFNKKLTAGEVTTLFNSPISDTTGAGFLLNFL